MRRRCLSSRINPNSHFFQCRGTEWRRQCDVRRVSTISDRNSVPECFFISRIESLPPPADKSLEPGVQVHWLEIVQIADHHSRRNVDGTAQCQAQMREVA